jgi:hypothetical protein
MIRNLRASFILFILFFALNASAQLNLKSETFDTHFIIDDKINKLSIKLNKEFIKDFNKDLFSLHKQNLESVSSEALDLITRSEWSYLSQRIEMSDVLLILKKDNVLQTKLKANCVKKSTVVVDSKTYETLFLSFHKNQNLSVFRKDIWRLYVQKGGAPEDFQWKRWSPAITMAYTASKKYDPDSVVRFKGNCLYSVKMK